MALTMARLVGTKESFENIRLEVAWYSAPCVAHVDHNFGIARLQLHFDLSSHWCVLDGVVHQVPYGSPQQSLVATERSLGEVPLELDAFVGGDHSGGANGLRQEFV